MTLASAFELCPPIESPTSGHRPVGASLAFASGSGRWLRIAVGIPKRHVCSAPPLKQFRGLVFGLERDLRLKHRNHLEKLNVFAIDSGKRRDDLDKRPHYKEAVHVSTWPQRVRKSHRMAAIQCCSVDDRFKSYHRERLGDRVVCRLEAGKHLEPM